jgi:hypothetical protein
MLTDFVRLITYTIYLITDMYVCNGRSEVQLEDSLRLVACNNFPIMASFIKTETCSNATPLPFPFQIH